MTGGARRALVVASDAYEAEGLRDLRSPRADAEALASVLGDPQIGDFDVDVVHNEPSYVVQAQVEELFAEAGPDDLVLLHLACHGLKSESGDLFFAARNTRLGRLESTAVPASFVQRCMRSSRSRSIVLLLDCCYGGAFGRGVSVRAAGPVDVVGSFPVGHMEGGRGRAVITASSAMEYSFEGTTLAEDRTAPSVFTEALVRGLTTGEADRDEDGWVSLNELYDYVFEQVRTSTPGQTPTRDVEMQGELYLARSRRRRVQPGPLPPDLLTASHDANVFTRLGAVSELRARLLGDNLPAAAGAHQRLVEMAEQDISYVATAAASAVADAVLGCDPLRIDLGQVPVAQSAPVRRVSTTGPPLARTCVVETSDPRIRVVEDRGDLEVSVDTAAPGPLSGTVTLRSLLGRQVVAVSAEVVPAPRAPVPEAVPITEDRVAVSAAPLVAAEREPAPEPAAESAMEPAMQPESAPGPEPALAPVPASGPGPGPGPAPGPGPTLEPGAAPGPALGRPAGGAPRRARVAGGLSVVGAGLMFWGTQVDFQWTDELRGYDPSWSDYVTIMSVLLAVAGAVVLALWSSWPAGAGLLLGVGVASSGGLVALVVAWALRFRPEGGVEAGLWLLMAGHVVVLLAAAVMALRVLPEVGAAVGPSEVPRAVVLSLAVAGAVAGGSLLVSAGRSDDEGSGMYWLVPIWTAVIVTAVPVTVAFVRPQALRVWLLVGWILGAGAGVARWQWYYDWQGDSDSVRAGTWAVVALAALVPLVVVLARLPEPSASSTESATTGGPDRR